MSPRSRRLLAQIGSFVLAGVLLYFALRGVDLVGVAAALQQAEYVWLAPLVAVVILSHAMRAWRWQALLEALPEEDGAPRRRLVPVREAFYSLMIGYMVNYAAPRLGEVARTANLSARERLRFSAVFGTVVVERMLDVFLLALALTSVFFLLLNRIETVDELLIAPIVEQAGRIPATGIALLTLGVGVLVLLVYWSAVRSEGTFLNTLWRDRIAPIMASFRDGLWSLLRARRPMVIIVSTMIMWPAYLMMAYIPFIMLDMVGPYDISLIDGWVIMLIGAIGMVVPSPGGVGSFHYITIQTLVHLYGVDAEAAATYAVLTHAAQLVLYVCLGVLSLILQGSSLQALRARTAEAQGGSSTRDEVRQV